MFKYPMLHVAQSNGKRRSFRVDSVNYFRLNIFHFTSISSSIFYATLNEVVGHLLMMTGEIEWKYPIQTNPTPTVLQFNENEQNR